MTPVSWKVFCSMWPRLPCHVWLCWAVSIHVTGCMPKPPDSVPPQRRSATGLASGGQWVPMICLSQALWNCAQHQGLFLPPVSLHNYAGPGGPGVRALEPTCHLLGREYLAQSVACLPSQLLQSYRLNTD